MSSDNAWKLTRTAELTAAALAGWCVIALPVILDPAFAARRTTGFAPWMGPVVEAIKPGSLALLPALGWVFGRWGGARVRYVGLACIATLPIWSTLDMLCGSDGHNLLPFEWAFYGFYGLLAAGGAWWGRRARPHGRSR